MLNFVKISLSFLKITLEHTDVQMSKESSLEMVEEKAQRDKNNYMFLGWHQYNLT